MITRAKTGEESINRSRWVGGVLLVAALSWLIGGDRSAIAALPANSKVNSADSTRGTVLLEGGKYTMGERGDTVTVGSFYMDETEVTVSAYRMCVSAEECTEPQEGEFCNWSMSGRSNHPVNCVDWNQAVVYCNWVGKRLPTEEEWEWAARGGNQGTKYPWGDNAPKTQLCWSGGGVNRYGRNLGTCKVGSYPGGNSPQGVKDLAGNVWEWTSTAWPKDGQVERGGGWLDNEAHKVNAYYRIGSPRGFANMERGFRCAKTK